MLRFIVFLLVYSVFGAAASVSVAENIVAGNIDAEPIAPVRIASFNAQTSASDGNVELTERNQRRVAELRKPLRSVRIVAATQETVPTSIADDLLGNSEPITISSSAEMLEKPSRYTVGFCHRPLYFEELNLERCGQTYGYATNAVSGFHFLTNTAMLPYRLATQRADCPVPTHGDCKACSQYSHDIEPFGFESRGVLVEAAAAAGFIFLML